MKRFILLVMIGLATNWIFACADILGLDEFVPAPAKPDGGVGQGGAECITASDCPGPDTSFCGARTCDNGVCGLSVKSDGIPTPSQLYGDCQVFVCDGEGNIMSRVNAADVYNDGNECTNDECIDGMISHLVQTGDPCMQGYCTSMGVCIQCAGNSDCSTIGEVCQASNCVPMHCTNGTKDDNETDTDCGGGDCNKCDVDKYCLNPDRDCKSGVCIGPMPSQKVCVAPSCNDGAINGTETAYDCGGFCPKCAASLACLLPSDCQSGVCKDNICQVPSCTDATQNGGETGVDCGGPTCDPC